MHTVPWMCGEKLEQPKSEFSVSVNLPCSKIYNHCTLEEKKYHSEVDFKTYYLHINA